MRDMTQQFIGSQLRILQASLASAAEAAANLASILVEPTDAQPSQGCQHPVEQRIDLTAMGDAPGSYWRCNACGSIHDMRGHHADDSQA